MKKICVVTGSRADYGLLYWPMKLMQESGFDLNLVVTGTHLSSIHGNSIELIKKDNFPISCTIDLNLDLAIKPGAPVTIARALGLFIEKFAEYLEDNKPDLLFVLGDRYEILGAAEVALIFNIPIAHVHGGEVTLGAIDDAIRHSLTKMANFHFVSNEQYKKRIIQLGEDPRSVFVTGAPGLDNFKRLKILSIDEIANDNEINFAKDKKNVLVTYHPVSNSEIETVSEIKALVDSVLMLAGKYNFVVTMPNADTFSELVMKELEKLKKNKNINIVKNLGQIRYLSLLKYFDLVLGNSSSGIIEAPFCGTPVINIGSRQKGRLTSEHVLTIENVSFQSLHENIISALEGNLKNTLPKSSDLYGDGSASEKIVNILKTLSPNNCYRKHFFDLERK